MSAEFVSLFNDDNTRSIVMGAVSAVWGEINWANMPPASQTSPYLFHRRMDHPDYGLVMVEKNVPAKPGGKKGLLEVQTFLFSEAIKTISLKTPVEKKEIALQLLGYQIHESKASISAERAANVVGMFLDQLGLHSTEIESLRAEIQALKGDKKRIDRLEERIERRLGRLKKKKIWYGNIGEACDEILKRVRVNEKLFAIDRTYPIEGESACKAFLDEFEFYDDPDYTVEKLHNYYRRVKN